MTEPFTKHHASPFFAIRPTHNLTLAVAQVEWMSAVSVSKNRLWQAWIFHYAGLTPRWMALPSSRYVGEWNVYNSVGWGNGSTDKHHWLVLYSYKLKLETKNGIITFHCWSYQLCWRAAAWLPCRCSSAAPHPEGWWSRPRSGWCHFRLTLYHHWSQ